MSGKKYCCNDMRRNVEHRCSRHKGNIWDCPDNLICYNDVFDEYGIIIHDGGSSYITINYCPFCGKELPESKREIFFDEIESLNVNIVDDELPEEFKTDEWWKKRGL